MWNQIYPVVKVVVPPWPLKKNISVLHVLHGILAEASLIVPDLAISVYGSSCNYQIFYLIFLIFFLYLFLGIPSCLGCADK